MKNEKKTKNNEKQGVKEVVVKEQHASKQTNT